MCLRIRELSLSVGRFLLHQRFFDTNNSGAFIHGYAKFASSFKTSKERYFEVWQKLVDSAQWIEKSNFGTFI